MLAKIGTAELHCLLDLVWKALVTDQSLGDCETAELHALYSIIGIPRVAEAPSRMIDNKHETKH